MDFIPWVWQIPVEEKKGGGECVESLLMLEDQTLY